MVVVDENFVGAGQKEGVEIWRIKQFNVEPVPHELFGNFYSGDSYIVLHTKPHQNWDIHYWLGTNTTQDEYGTAAYKAVELDQLLGGFPVQYRQVQGYEGSNFLTLFKGGVKYLKGGYASGFNHVVEEKIEPRLFQCKGKRYVRCWQVGLSYDSLNKGDVFILDAGREIYVWFPPYSGRLERIAGINVARNIRDSERAGRGNIHILDTDWNNNDSFFRKIGGKKDYPIKDAAAGGIDEGNYQRNIKPKIGLWKVSDASGKVTVSKAGEGDLPFELLDSNDAFILDTAIGNVFVWVGKKCTDTERKKAMSYAENYLKEMKKPPHTQVVRVLDTGEPGVFLQWFTHKPKNAPKITPKLFHCSDETGTLVVDEIVNFDQDDLDTDDVMILDAVDTIYVWVGIDANDKEKQHAYETAQQYVNTDTIPRPQKVALVTIQQGSEPQEFRKYFDKWDLTKFGKLSVSEVIKRVVN